jgi:hypothetical protein
MNSPRFKVGDVVVEINDPDWQRKIIGIDDFEYDTILKLRTSSSNGTRSWLTIGYVEKNFELAEIWDSPLYQALREEE